MSSVFHARARRSSAPVSSTNTNTHVSGEKRSVPSIDETTFNDDFPKKSNISSFLSKRQSKKGMTPMRRKKQQQRRSIIKKGVILSGIIFLIQFLKQKILVPHIPLKIEKNTDTKGMRRTLPIKRSPVDDPDGSFHGYPVYLREVTKENIVKPPHTNLNCLGQNWQPDAWMHRSCHFNFFCFNMTSREYQVYQHEDEQILLQWSDKVPLMDLSESLLTNTSFVSLGGINIKWEQTQIERLKWFPKILTGPPLAFYALPPEVVMVPYHSLGGWNPGHATWDDFLPIFTLLDIFQMPMNSLLALRQSLDGEGLWASCEASSRLEACQTLQKKFWPLLSNNTGPVTQKDVVLDVDNRRTDLVCAKNAVAGIGDLTDHGTKKLHGWHFPEDYQRTHNHGRGGTFWRFRNFCLENLGIPVDISSREKGSSFQIVISSQSSSNAGRNLNFNEQRLRLTDEFKDENIVLKSVVLKDMTLEEQVRMASETNVFITGCGGGSATATFLPKDATLILYYNEEGGQKHNVPTGLPARLDWDFFNHLSHIHTFWFPSKTMNKKHDLKTLSSIVRDVLSRQRQHIEVQNVS